MSTATITVPVHPSAAADRQRPAPIPFGRLLGVELRKMFDTRSGFWLMAAIVLGSLAATAAVILFAPDSELTYETFASAIGMPMSVVLPMIAILSVTGEWTQRSALTTFTLVPSRGRVIAAKLVCAVAVGVAAMVVAAAVGALGNVVGSAIAGVDTTWTTSLAELGKVSLASVIGMLMGFVLGVVLRGSAAAIVGYFVYSLVLPGITTALMMSQEWYYDNVGWIDFNFATMQLYNDSMTGEQWLQLGVTGLVWMALPLLVGLRFLLRSEVK